MSPWVMRVEPSSMRSVPSWEAPQSSWLLMPREDAGVPVRSQKGALTRTRPHQKLTLLTPHSAPHSLTSNLQDGEKSLLWVTHCLVFCYSHPNRLRQFPMTNSLKICQSRKQCKWVWLIFLGSGVYWFFIKETGIWETSTYQRFLGILKNKQC